jgi:hypothetical protein
MKLFLNVYYINISMSIHCSILVVVQDTHIGIIDVIFFIIKYLSLQKLDQYNNKANTQVLTHQNYMNHSKTGEIFWPVGPQTDCPIRG